jgi:hypothetical protein
MTLASSFPGRSVFNVKNRVSVLKRREQRMLAQLERIAPPAENDRLFDQTPMTCDANGTAIRQDARHKADPDRFLSMLTEPLESLFDDSSADSTAPNQFFEWQS